MFEEPHCGQRIRAAEMSGSVASHSTMRLCALSKSLSSTITFALACGRDMNPTCCKGASLCTSALRPASWKHRFRCLAFSGSLNVAIVTINFIRSPGQLLIKHQLTGERKIRRRVICIHFRVESVTPILFRTNAASPTGQRLLRWRRKPFVEHQIYEHPCD